VLLLAYLSILIYADRHDRKALAKPNNESLFL
jgi:hypothetical protein